MSESLILKSADVDALADLIATVVVERVAKQLDANKRRLVDREEMAALANVSVPTLDRLVAAEAVPSLRIGNRRLFDPDAFLDALAAEGGK